MIKDVAQIEGILRDILLEQTPTLRVRKNGPEGIELCGTKEAMQGKQKVDGFYFASIVPKPKDIRLYYFPIYTHVNEFDHLSEDLRKCLKGKSCFHIKKLDDGLIDEIRDMVKKGVELYQKDDLI